jgi:hypothetical protein
MDRGGNQLGALNEDEILERKTVTPSDFPDVASSLKGAAVPTSPHYIKHISPKAAGCGAAPV